MNEFDPYQHPAYAPNPAYATNQPPASPGKSLPTFALVVLIADLFFCFLRALAGAAGVFAFTVIEAGSPLFIIGCLEVFAAAGIVLAGGLGDALILAKQRFGILLGWIAVGFTIFSILVGLGTLPFQFGQMQQNPAFQGQNVGAAKVGMVLGAGFTLLIRIGILVAYGAALRMASRVVR